MRETTCAPSSTSSTTDRPGVRDTAAEPPRLLEVGRVVKPHGLSGEVVVELWGDAERRLVAGSALASDAGDLEVVSARPHQHRHLVRFAGVDDHQAAERLRGVLLRAEPLDLPGVIWVHDVVGAQLVTTDGRVLGEVVAVEANPASDLLVLEGGGLVPLHFVTDVQPRRRVTVDAPDGLVE